MGGGMGHATGRLFLKVRACYCLRVIGAGCSVGLRVNPRGALTLTWAMQPAASFGLTRFWLTGGLQYTGALCVCVCVCG